MHSLIIGRSCLVSGALLTLLIVFSSGCAKEEAAPTTIYIFVDTVAVPANAVADVDGNIYQTTLIGGRRWMAENLRSGHFANGDPIPYQPGATQWSQLSEAGWSNYDLDASYDEVYGKLYNWYAVNDARNVCPSGWHVPTDGDWMALEEMLGLSEVELEASGARGVGVNAGGHLKAVALWDAPNTGATDSTGFTAYPGGIRSMYGGYTNVGTRGHWWTATPFDTVYSWCRELSTSSRGIYRVRTNRLVGASVRCVKN
jgi:uncharacterized protein (TIGR02145 family)